MEKKLQLINISINNRIGKIELNRPEKRNALSPELIEELKLVFNSYKDNSNVKIIVLKANGEAFCAGADLEYLQKMQNFTYEENLADSVALSKLFEVIYTYPKIVIAQVEGHALAGGAGLALVCDFIYSAPEAKFGFTEVKIGFVPALVSFFLVRKIGEARARDLLLSGRLITSEKAFEFGFINEVISADKIENEVIKAAVKLSETTSGQSIQTIKQMLLDIDKQGISESLSKLAEINAKARLNTDCIKGISAFLNKQSVKW